MGSVEVYDYKKMQWVPYVPDFEKWRRHFEDVSAGRVRPDHKGRYIVGSGSRHRADPTPEKNKPVVKLVTPVAQAIEMAKSELKRENEDYKDNSESIRKSRKNPLPGQRASKPSRKNSKKARLLTQFDV